MGNYIVLSLETHLFFSRIMKEHAMFLQAGFPCTNQNWIRQADWYKQQFENQLRDVTMLSDGRVSEEILKSDEIITEFTIPAENNMEQLTSINIDGRISRRQQNLTSGYCDDDNREIMMSVKRINSRAVELLDGFIEFKEKILKCVNEGSLFNANYPLLIEHILREAKLYRITVKELMDNQEISYKSLRDIEEFWNQIMMEHALFIRGLLDPTEEELIKTAHCFAKDYKELLERARQQDCRVSNLSEQTLAKTLEYRDFKAAGAEGILNCEIASIIMPLLADHVLREANHYIRLLKAAK